MNNNLTRRDFVRIGSGAVVAGAALKTTLLEPQPLWSQETSGSKIRFASIGLGVRGMRSAEGGTPGSGSRMRGSQ